MWQLLVMLSYIEFLQQIDNLYISRERHKIYDITFDVWDYNTIILLVGGERTEETNASTLVRVTSRVTISPKIHCEQTQM